MLRFFRRSAFLIFFRLVSHPSFHHFAYLVLCLVSFHPSRLRSRSCSIGARPAFLFVSSDSSVRFPLPSLSFVRFGLGSDYLASVSSVPFFPAFPYGGSFRCCPFPVPSFPQVRFTSLSAFRFACFHASLPVLVLGLPAIPFDHVFSPYRCYFLSRFSLPFQVSAFPLGFRFRFCLLGGAMHLQN